MLFDSMPTAAYIRIASLSIALFEYIQTTPTAFRLYRTYVNRRRLGVHCLLFFLIRFTSVLVLVASNVGYFHDNFTLQACQKFYLVPLIFHGFQTPVSNLILALRAYNLSRRSTRVGFGLSVFFVVAVASQWVTNLIYRTPSVTSAKGCIPLYTSTAPGGWPYYLISIIYDLVTTSISVFYLLRWKYFEKSPILSKLRMMMLQDGIAYLIALTSVNFLNVIASRSLHIQSALASLGFAVTWIMSQRLLIHLMNASIDQDAFHNVTAHDLSGTIRSYMNPKHDAELNDDASLRRKPSSSLRSLNLEVHVERTVRLDRDSRGYELEDGLKLSRSAI